MWLREVIIMTELDQVSLRSVTAMDGEGFGFGANVVPVEVIARRRDPVMIGEVKVVVLLDHPEATAIVAMINEGGPAHGQH